MARKTARKAARKRVAKKALAAKRVSRPKRAAKRAAPRARAAGGAKSREEANKELARRFVHAVSRGDVDAIVAAYAPDGVCWTAGTMPISGTYTVDQVRGFASGVLQAFPEGLTFTIHAMTAEGDRVAIEAESFGTHASGKTYNNQYHFLMRVTEDGRIAEWREYMDTMHANDVLCATA